jgi:hypothetical protein
MNPKLATIVLVLAALASACAPSFEADVPDVEITQHGLTMPGVPAAAQLGEVSVTSSFSFSSCTTAWAKRLNSEVFAHKVTIATSESSSDLSFIALARVTARDPGRAESATALLDYARIDGMPPSSDIEVGMPTPIDITRLWSADQVIIELQAAGQLPEQDWTVDVTLHLSGKITGRM